MRMKFASNFGMIRCLSRKENKIIKHNVTRRAGQAVPKDPSGENKRKRWAPGVGGSPLGFRVGDREGEQASRSCRG